VGKLFNEDLFRKILKKFMKDFEEFEKQFFKDEFLEEEPASESEEYFYGFSITIGPDGKPVIREFGSKPKRKHIIEEKPFGTQTKPRIVEVPEENPEDVDVFEYDDVVEVVAEIRNVSKEDIDVKILSDKQTLIIKAPEYYRKVKLPVKVNPSTAKAHYRNGVLEVTIRKQEKKEIKTL